ncbi:MAG: FAD-dependent oxidoreductase [Gammaproteobacteria bacterium]|nr:FAD-dependent oxidoreductase [Gammaproteobacteria bacterium]
MSDPDTTQCPTRLDPPAHIAVIGAGIIGTCCAAELRDRGYRVALYDRGEPGQEGASRANAGQLIPSLIQPIAYPGIWRDAPRLLAARDSPLAIAPSHLPRLVTWLCRFLASSRRDAWRRGVASLAELNAGAMAATRDLYGRAGLLDSLENTGALFLHESPASLDRARADWTEKSEHGYEHEILSPQALRDLEPDLAASFSGAILERSVCHVSDPLKIVEGLYRYTTARGTVFRRSDVRIAAAGGDGVELAGADGGRERFDGLVIAAGAWSRQLLRQIGDDAALESDRGYNITIPDPGVAIRRCLVFADRGFVATPLKSGLRIGGGVELAGLAAPPNPIRLQRMLEAAKRFMPGLDDRGGETWMGHRPATPDSLPVIRASDRHPRIVYAFGHGHLGLTQGPVTGRRVAGLFAGTGAV